MSNHEPVRRTEVNTLDAPAAPIGDAAKLEPGPATVSSNPRERWSAKKSALTAAVAIGLTSAASIGAAAAIPAGTSSGGMGGPGGSNHQFGGANQNGQLGPGTTMPNQSTSGQGSSSSNNSGNSAVGSGDASSANSANNGANNQMQPPNGAQAGAPGNMAPPAS